QDHVLDGLVGHLAYALDHLAGQRRRRLSIDHNDAVVAHDNAGIGIALGGESVEAGADLLEGDLLIGEISSGGEGFGHAGAAPGFADVFRPAMLSEPYRGLPPFASAGVLT